MLSHVRAYPKVVTYIFNCTYGMFNLYFSKGHFDVHIKLIIYIGTVHITTSRYFYRHYTYGQYLYRTNLYALYLYELYLYVLYFYRNLYKYEQKKQKISSILLRVYTSIKVEVWRKFLSFFIFISIRISYKYSTKKDLKILILNILV